MTEWGPWCWMCGHPSAYHGKTFCNAQVGLDNKKPCDCDGYVPDPMSPPQSIPEKEREAWSP